MIKIINKKCKKRFFFIHIIINKIKLIKTKSDKISNDIINIRIIENIRIIKRKTNGLKR